MTTIPEPERRRATTGSPEQIVRSMTDLELQDDDRVSKMTRGLGWDPEPEAFRAVAKRELAWRRQQGVAFGWHRVTDAEEREQARLDFVARFVWNDEDTVILRAPEGRYDDDDEPCLWCTPSGERRAPVNRIYDYEDDEDANYPGGAPICEHHTEEIRREAEPIASSWVTQDPERAWSGVAVEGNGWNTLWRLFAH